MKQSIRLGTIRGIVVGVHWSVAAILVLFAWDLAEYQLPAHRGHAGVDDWIAGVVGAVVLLLSLFAHELSHALVARRNGVTVRSITLFVFGGVTQLEGEAHTPGADFWIAVVGPGTSVALAAVFAGGDALWAWASGHGLPTATLTWLWEINLLLAAFNMVPAAPLDGGRVLRAILWRRWGSRPRASLAATRIGRGFGAVLVVLGVLGIFYVGVTGLWAVLIGFFLYSCAISEEQYELIQEALTGLTVGQVMLQDPPTVPATATVSDLLSLFQWRYRGDAVVVTDERGAPTGVITTRAVRRLDARRRATAVAAQISIPATALPVARPDEPVGALVERIVAHEGHPALVFDATGHLVGLVSLSDVERAASWEIARRGRPPNRPSLRR